MFLKNALAFFIITFLLIGSSNTLAADANRFADIRHKNTVIGQFDTETVRYKKDPYRNELLLDVWIKTLPDQDSGSYSLYHYLFRIKEREMMSLDQIQFSPSGKILSKLSNKYDPTLWTSIIPETDSENWYLTIADYTQANDKKLQEEYKKRMRD